MCNKLWTILWINSSIKLTTTVHVHQQDGKITYATKHAGKKKKVECLNITTECRDTFMISKNVKIEKSTKSKNNTLI